MNEKFAVLLLVCGASAFVPRSRHHAIISCSPVHHSRSLIPREIGRDTEFIFGSDAVNLPEDDDEAEGEDEYSRDQRERQQVVDKLLAHEDEKFKEERRKKNWGEFAGVKTKEDILRVERSVKAKISRENKRKAQLARLQGVQLEVLEPKDGTVSDDNGNVQISSGSSSLNWHNKMDDDLQKEWEDMESGNEQVADGQQESIDTIQVNGKVVPRESLQGVRVGSAGGWALEVFPGDFVVHRKYGIGRFEKTCLRPKSKLTQEEQTARDARRGEILKSELEKISGGVTAEDIQRIRSKFGTEEDFDPISNPQSTVLEIAYSDGIVHVPVERAYRLSRYRGRDAVVKPKLSKVRGGAWTNAKKRVEENTLLLAQDVLALYAKRETLQRKPFDPAKEDEVKEFGKTFQFEPTPDQVRCFEDVENDMVWRVRPMDRLVCGDVGFGKTEVAMRALYRAVVNGRQAALLAPTGVLASQHYKQVIKRMGEGTRFNKRIALLRGGMGKRTKAGQVLREQIKNGEVDVIVGTHALISNDVDYGNLGLLVVDEEQRFGVKQKERLKLICEGIDVLTLSATPIPRTLQMSLSGIRDTSTIRSPPPMRKPTITYVQDFSEEVVKMAIGNELERGGQCYYVVPRISMLQEADKLIKECFPRIRLVWAHGRMSRNTAEDNVAAFAEGNYDVLLATTVIENGVDIPSVNTIIIQESQIFGMSTLYQLRGRVGRSDLQGYAYLLHREDGITEQAMMRLQSIGELHELGSGFDVANRDLEIRGAGSLLGTEQSGMAARVGFDLYMRMLKKSVRRLRGLDLPLVPRTNVLLPKQEGSLEIKRKTKDGIVTDNAFQIPESFISDAEERSTQVTAARLAETTSSLVDLTNSWKEKYGPVPAVLQKKLKTLHLHACTRKLGIDLIGLIGNGNGRVDCIMRSPGLRPRHWGIVLPLLNRGVPPKGLDVVFPARFTLSGDEQEIIGGEKVDLKELLEDSTLDDDADNWDALDQEEIEALKEISSAYTVKSLDEIDIDAYPRFVIKDFAQNKSVDQLLQLLLPVAKVVTEKQEAEKEAAKVASELREKRELLQNKKALNDSTARRMTD